MSPEVWWWLRWFGAQMTIGVLAYYVLKLWRVM